MDWIVAAVIVILLPCFNEADSLGATLRGLPRTVARQPVKVIVVDDGSTDDMAQVAHDHGAQVLSGPHLGLAATFRRGLASLPQNTVCAVVMDGDGQYDPAYLDQLVQPVLVGRADLVLGERAGHRAGLSPVRRVLHLLGTLMTRWCTGLPVHDPISGYRAYSPATAQRLQVHSRYTYTLETLAQVRPLGLRLETVQLPARPTRRPSRLFRNVRTYVVRQALTLLWATWTYRCRPGLLMMFQGKIRPMTAGHPGYGTEP